MLLIILVPIGVLVVGKKKQSSTNAVVGLGKGAKGGDISDIDPNSVPVGF